MAADGIVTWLFQSFSANEMIDHAKAFYKEIIKFLSAPDIPDDLKRELESMSTALKTIFQEMWSRCKAFIPFVESNKHQCGLLLEYGGKLEAMGETESLEKRTLKKKYNIAIEMIETNNKNFEEKISNQTESEKFGKRILEFQEKFDYEKKKFETFKVICTFICTFGGGALSCSGVYAAYAIESKLFGSANVMAIGGCCLTTFQIVVVYVALIGVGAGIGYGISRLWNAYSDSKKGKNIKDMENRLKDIKEKYEKFEKSIQQTWSDVETMNTRITIAKRFLNEEDVRQLDMNGIKKLGEFQEELLNSFEKIKELANF